jgi:hypothetical protein
MINNCFKINLKKPITLNVEILVPRSPRHDLERLSLAWNHASDKKSLKIRTLEQGLIEKVYQLF